MKRVNRLVIFTLVSVLMLAIAAPSFAKQDTSEGENTGTTLSPAQISEGEGPAVPAPPPDEKNVDQPWTARFIYPTIVIITILLIIGLVVGYNRGVIRRYKVVS